METEVVLNDDELRLLLGVLQYCEPEDMKGKDLSRELYFKLREELRVRHR